MLKNGSSQDALLLTAQQEASWGNAIQATVRDDLSDSSQDELVLSGGPCSPGETYDYPNADLANLVAQINTRQRLRRRHSTGREPAERAPCVRHQYAVRPRDHELLRARLERRILQQHRRLRVREGPGLRSAHRQQPDDLLRRDDAVLLGRAPGEHGQRRRRRGQPVLGRPAELPEAVDPADAALPEQRPGLPGSADLPLDADARSPALPAPGRGRSHVRRSARRRRHRRHVLLEQHDLSGRHRPLLARPCRRREPDRPDLVGYGNLPEEAGHARAQRVEPGLERHAAGVGLEPRPGRVVVRHLDRLARRDAPRVRRLPHAGDLLPQDDRHGRLPLAGPRQLPEGLER